MYSWVPSVFPGPTFTILLTGAFVCTGVPSSDLVTSPFTIVWVTVVSSSPREPSCSTTTLPGSNELSTLYSVSNSIALVFLVSRVPVKSFLPTLITAFTGSVVSTSGFPTISEFLIVQVVFFVPSVPGTSITYSPDFRFGS